MCLDVRDPGRNSLSDSSAPGESVLVYLPPSTAPAKNSPSLQRRPENVVPRRLSQEPLSLRHDARPKRSQPCSSCPPAPKPPRPIHSPLSGWDGRTLVSQALTDRFAFQVCFEPPPPSTSPCPGP